MLDKRLLNAVRVKRTLQDCIKDRMLGMLCMECALGYLNLCTFSYNASPMYYVEMEGMSGCVTDYITFLFVSKIDWKGSKEISEGIYVPSKERAVCDMIKYDGIEFHILEAIDWIYLSNFAGGVDVDKDLLEYMAKEEGIYNKLVKFKHDVIELGGKL